MLIRPLHDNDVSAVACLLNALAWQFIVHESTPAGAATFLRENDGCAIRRHVAIGHVYHVAELEGEIAGFVGVRECNHLFHMFFDVQWQRQGVGRQLWEAAQTKAIAAGGSGQFTVNASNFAVPMYQVLGFARTAPMQSLKGLFFNPMTLGER